MAAPTSAMSPQMRTGVTIATLLALMVIGLMWAVNAAFEPFPDRSAEAPPPCTEGPVNKGETVVVDQVVVTVLNAGNRSGLADAVLNDLADVGFIKGSSGNAPDEAGTRNAVIWADKQNPAAQLVQKHLGKRVRILKPKVDTDFGPGVLVIVGENFGEVTDGPESVKAKAETTFCRAEPPDPA